MFHLPKELVDHIISFTVGSVFELCLVNKYFNDNCKRIRITSNKKYPDLTDKNLKQLIGFI